MALALGNSFLVRRQRQLFPLQDTGVVKFVHRRLVAA